ncbi:MAG: helix-turn-helix transcriptional regulator [Gemmatimonadaceae bacterium]|nr:helix-turn-helix transcriptional regulator [Gemmatimonadaceae bacterium]
MPTPTPQSRRTTAAKKQPGRRNVRPLPRVAREDKSDLCEVEVVDHDKVARARAALPDPSTLVDLAELLRALGDPTRLQIVCALATDDVDELCVCDIATLVNVSESAVSHSLRTLRQLGVVKYRKAGKIAYYMLDDAHVAQLVREGVRHIQHDE